MHIDGGLGGFAARTVSLTDLAWIVMADRNAEQSGDLLDETRVNRGRYLEGTPRCSTRWNDTGCAIAAYAAVRDRVDSPSVQRSRVVRVRDESGREIDASFRIERAPDGLSLVFASHGGAGGSAGVRNHDHGAGLGLLLARLDRAQVSLPDLRVEFERTQDLPDVDRRVVLEGRPFPVTVDDPAALRQALGTAQARIGRRPGAKSPGNNTRRLRLVLAVEELRGAADEAAERFASESGSLCGRRVERAPPHRDRRDPVLDGGPRRKSRTSLAASEGATAGRAIGAPPRLNPRRRRTAGGDDGRARRPGPPRAARTRPSRTWGRARGRWSVTRRTRP